MDELFAQPDAFALNRFVGRERELAELKSALDEAREGRGRLFLISGEPGIGKTRLAEQIANEAAARGMQVLWGRCWEGDGAPAYWPWIQIIRGCIDSADSRQYRAVLESVQMPSAVEAVAKIVPELRAFSMHPHQPTSASALDPDQARFQLFDAVTTLLKNFARLRPLMIAIDDLHDADGASLMMLRFVARELKLSRLLILATYRELEVKRSPQLGKEIGDLSHEARAMPLAGFSLAEVARFSALNMAQAPNDQFNSRLHAATAGNPLFVDGIVRMLASGPASGDGTALNDQLKIPHSLNEMIRRRLANLSDDSRSLINVAAVIGNEFDAGVCAQAAGITRDEFDGQLQEISSLGIASGVGRARFRFAHSLIRAAIYDALDRRARIGLHAKIGEVIEEKYAPDPTAHLGELAHHFFEAGLTEKAIDYSFRAGLAGDGIDAYSVAGPHLRTALALTEGHNDLRRAHILLNLGRIGSLHLDRAEGVELLKTALKLFEELKCEEWIAETHSALGIAFVAHAGFGPETKISEALDHFHKAQAWKGQPANQVGYGWLHFGLALCLHFADRHDEAIDAVKQARTIWERAARPEWVSAAALHGLCLVVKGRHREATVLFAEVAAFAEEARRAPNIAVFTSAMQSAGWCRLVMGDPIEARRLYSMALSRKGLSPHHRKELLNYLGRVEANAGNLEGVLAIASELGVNPNLKSAFPFLGGDWDGVVERFLPPLAWLRRTGFRWDEANHLVGLFVQLLVIGDLQQSQKYLKEALHTYDRGDLLIEMEVRPRAALLAIAMGNVDDAVQHLEVCRNIIEQEEDWKGLSGNVERAMGMLAAAQGLEFASHFEIAIGSHKRWCLPWEEADTLYDWGVALTRAGDGNAANEKFDGAIEIYRRCGAGQRWIDRVEAARKSSARAHKSLPTHTASGGTALLRKEGEFWTIAYQGATSRLKDIKGLAYLAFLLAHPGERYHAKDLAAIVDGAAVGRNLGGSPEASDLTVVSDLDGAAPGLDPRARADYRSRMNDLRGEIEEADRFNDIGRATRAREELDFLKAELASAAGIGGRPRRSGSHAERARLMVGKNIHAAIDKIRRVSPALGRHFATSIRTGYFCSYQPDPEQTIAWQL
jgi:tetratricopeptide (TPR) repeat protein